MALTNHWKNAKATPLLAAGLMACASVLVAPEARADNSLWGKAMNSIGLGGGDQAAPAATPPATPAVASPKPAASAPKPTAATPKANVQPQQPKQDAANNNAVVHPAAPQANVAPPAPPAEGGNLLTNWFGWGRGGDSANSSGPAPTQKALAPIDVVAPPPPPPAPPRASEPSMWDKMLGSAGVGNGGVSMDSINYNERQKLAVPKDRVLPQPQAIGSEPPATRAANSDYLIKPPADYMEKAKGADGTVSGLRDVDQPKDKKFFGLF